MPATYPARSCLTAHVSLTPHPANFATLLILQSNSQFSPASVDGSSRNSPSLSSESMTLSESFKFGEDGVRKRKSSPNDKREANSFSGSSSRTVANPIHQLAVKDNIPFAVAWWNVCFGIELHQAGEVVESSAALKSKLGSGVLLLRVTFCLRSTDETIVPCIHRCTSASRLQTRHVLADMEYLCFRLRSLCSRRWMLWRGTSKMCRRPYPGCCGSDTFSHRDGVSPVSAREDRSQTANAHNGWDNGLQR